MADFPSKVTTETSSPNSRSSQPGGSSLRALAAGLATPLHSSFIRSIRAVLMMAEIVCNRRQNFKLLGLIKVQPVDVLCFLVNQFLTKLKRNNLDEISFIIFK